MQRDKLIGAVNGAAILAVIIMLVVVFTRLSSAHNDVVTTAQRSLARDARNVETWCGAIDSLQATLLLYVADISKLHPGARLQELRLPALDCPALTRATLAAR